MNINEVFTKLSTSPFTSSSRLSWWGGIIGVIVGLISGVLAGFQPLILCLLVVTTAILFSFFTHFEQTVLGLLVLRSSLDIFSDWQIPAVFAIALDCLTLIYIAILLLTHQKIRTDWFWWFLAIWVVIQGLWVIILPLGGLGLGGSFTLDAIREWVRIFSWLMVYLLVMQLQDKMSPEKIIKILFLSLIIPLVLALMQLVIPGALPEILSATSVRSVESSMAVSRVRGTLGHSNTFTTFLLFFISLTIWQLEQNKRKTFWLCLLGILAFFFASAKALFGLIALVILVFVLIIPRLNFINLIGGTLLLLLILGFFISSDFGQERLGSLTGTPLLNPDIDLWKAILLSRGDGNSFNWRLAEWQYLWEKWKLFPWWGYGLGLSPYVSDSSLLPHNDYLRALVEGGIIGFFSFLSLFLVQGLRLYELFKSSSRRQKNLCFIMLALLIALAVGMITENIWSHTTLFFYWYTVLAILGWNWPKEKNTNYSQQSKFSNSIELN
ncbi:MAG: O-antigen ligase family protein [Pleurocapsa sp.]